ncbi:MAG: DEAD/DEAH box helicase [Betaproteobacteria bacterium]
MAESKSFDLLDERIQRWIWNEGWEELRDAQERAIPAILSGTLDVIIAAATAAGKTEAAFFPILTRLLQKQDDSGLVIYISPLKALINDQFGRMERLCEILEIPVWPWHGDIGATVKAKFSKNPTGVLLITPESLEATLCNRGFQVAHHFAGTQYIVVDELHAFIGSERGKQLQSIMHRIETAIGRAVCRIGLSATLGDMRLAAEFLRPRAGEKTLIIESKSDERALKLQIKGYEDVAVAQPIARVAGDIDRSADSSVGADEAATVEVAIARHLFSVLRGSNNLVFPNSRNKVEKYTYLLRRMCEEAHVPNEFWPHHGSLSKEIRTDTEAALKSKERPATAICTNTLELGIDIGAVKSIAQIGSPPSVASLRQRLGRSGRRKGEPAILRGYCVEQPLDSRSHPLVLLREGTFESAAMVSLLLDAWFEPPITSGAHLSTLTQQLLSLIAQHGGVSAGESYTTLCANGPFTNISKDAYVELLKELGRRELIQQESSGALLHGRIGEKMVNHYSFYSAFASEEEFRVIAGSSTLGSLPITTAIQPNDLILFAGKTWRIDSVDETQKTIYVVRHRGGRAPAFGGSGGIVDDVVRQRMKQLYEQSTMPSFLDSTATRFFSEGRATFKRLELSKSTLLRLGADALLFTWHGDRLNEAVAMMLKRGGFAANISGPAVELIGLEKDRTTGMLDYLKDIADGPVPIASELLQSAKNLQREKWDWALPEELLQYSYASLHLDIEGAHQWVKQFVAAER